LYPIHIIIQDINADRSDNQIGRSHRS